MAVGKCLSLAGTTGLDVSPHRLARHAHRADRIRRRRDRTARRRSRRRARQTRTPGFPLAWDNVFYDSPSLRHVVSTHQRGIDHGPTTFTYYYPLCDPNPAAPASASSSRARRLGRHPRDRPFPSPPRPPQAHRAPRRDALGPRHDPPSSRLRHEPRPRPCVRTLPQHPLRQHGPQRRAVVRGGAVSRVRAGKEMAGTGTNPATSGVTGRRANPGLTQG